MAKKSAKIEKLEAVLTGDASEEKWSAITSTIGRWREPDLSEVGIPLAQEVLEEWPDEIMRHPPMAWKKRFVRLEDEPRLLLCNALEFENGPRTPDEEGLKKLFRSTLATRLVNIRSLHIHRAELQRVAMEGWARSGNFSSVRDLVLDNHAYGSCAPRRTALENRDMKRIVSSKNVQRLERLALHSNWLEDEEVLPLVQARCWGGLRALDLNNNHIGSKGAKAIAENPSLQNLGSLDLGYNRELDEEGLEAIAHSTHLLSLRKLDIGQTSIDRDLEILLSSPLMSRLEVLHLSQYSYTPEALSLLCSCAAASNLRVLDARVSLNVEAARVMAASEYVANLETVKLIVPSEQREECFEILASSDKLHPTLHEFCALQLTY